MDPRLRGDDEVRGDDDCVAIGLEQDPAVRAFLWERQSALGH
jgi:hypothetical protein